MEEEDNSPVRYYSTLAQLQELLNAIDWDKYERDLYEGILEEKVGVILFSMGFSLEFWYRFLIATERGIRL